MKFLLLTILLLVAVISDAKSNLYLVYEGKKLQSPQFDVRFEVLIDGANVYVHCEGEGIKEAFLRNDQYAFGSYNRIENKEVMVYLVKPGFTGLSHMPFLKGLDSVAFGMPNQSGLVRMMSGGSAIVEDRREPISLKVASEKPDGEACSLQAEFEGDVSMSVSQEYVEVIGGIHVPKRSYEEYRDGRGFFSYEWKLTSIKKGSDCPSLPTVEEFLGESATVQDSRDLDNRLAFAYAAGEGSFEKQLAASQALHRELAKEDRTDWLKLVLSAVLAGLFTMCAGILLWKRSKAA